LVSMAPGRVNLIGEHIDYNDGYVLPMAIERNTVVVGGRSDLESEARIHSMTMGEDFFFDVTKSPGKVSACWVNYLLGVVDGFMELGGRIPPFDLVIDSTVPMGGGLSSSASLEVAFATFLEELLKVSISPKDKALLCQRAEHRFAGVPCGIMDQFASTVALEDHILLLDCMTCDVRHVPFGCDELTVLIANTNVRHALSDGEYARRRAECEAALKKMGRSSFREVGRKLLGDHKASLSSGEYKRARHVVTETTRTLEAAERIEVQDWGRVGELMFESHHSLRDDFEVSCRELDIMVEKARDIGIEGGVYGCRMTGGGFGGCVVALARTDRVGEIKQRLRLHYLAETGLEPDFIISRPSQGGRILPAVSA